MLEELPGADGLSRTERQSLAVLAEGGTTPVALFAAVQRQAAFMGDWSFFSLLNGLALAPKPLIDGLMGAPFRPNGSSSTQPYLQSTLTLTPFGAEVLACRADHAAQNRIDRWWGGTHLTNECLWRWDAGRSETDPPAPVTVSLSGRDASLTGRSRSIRQAETRVRRAAACSGRPTARGQDPGASR
jgi:hypothetical protein